MMELVMRDWQQKKPYLNFTFLNLMMISIMKSGWSCAHLFLRSIKLHFIEDFTSVITQMVPRKKAQLKI